MKILDLVTAPISWTWTQLKNSSWKGRTVLVIGGAALVYLFLQRRKAPEVPPRQTTPSVGPSGSSPARLPAPGAAKQQPAPAPRVVEDRPLGLSGVFFFSGDPDFQNKRLQSVSVIILEMTDNFPSLSLDFRGTQTEVNYRREVNQFIRKFHERLPQIIQMIKADPWFDGYPLNGWEACMKSCDAILEAMRPSKFMDIYQIAGDFKQLIVRLKTENDARQKFLSDRLKRIIDVGQVPHYFLDTYERYVEYVRLNIKELESLLGRTMHDIGLDTLEGLKSAICDTDFIPLIENLRLLSLYLRYELQKRQCRELTPDLVAAYKTELYALHTKMVNVLRDFEAGHAKEALSQLQGEICGIANNAQNPDNIPKGLDQLKNCLKLLERLDPEKQLIQILRHAKNIAASLPRR